MKIFYVTSSSFYSKNKKSYDYTIKIAQAQGQHSVKHYVSKIMEDAHSIENLTESHFKKAADEQKAMLKNSDVVIADLTDSTGAVGFHIASAINEKKPVLVIRQRGDKKKRKRITGPIIGTKSRLMRHKEYSNEAELKDIISKFLIEAKQQLDTKFILIISPAIDRYLEWSSDYKRMHKAQIVREAVEDMMKKDRDWKEFQSE